MTEQARRRNRQGEESRLKLLDAALHIAAHSGYRAATIARISAETGLPGSSIFWHFGNKRELIAEAIEHSYRQSRSTSPRWTDRSGDGDLEARLLSNLTYGREPGNPQEFWRLGLTLILEGGGSDSPGASRFMKMREESLSRIRGWWADALTGSGYPNAPGNVEYMADLTLAFLDGRFVDTALAGEYPPVLTRMAARGLLAAAAAGALPEAQGVPEAAADHGLSPAADAMTSRGTLIRAAERVMAARGFEGATIAGICKEAGLPASSLYWSFKDKDDLLVGVLKQAGRSWLTRLPRWEPVAGMPWEPAVHRHLMASLNTVDEDPALLRIGHLLALQHSGSSEGGRAAFRRLRTGTAGAWARWLRANLPQTARPPMINEAGVNMAGVDEARELAEVVMTIFDGLFLASRIQPGSIRLGVHSRALVEILAGARTILPEPAA